MSTRKQRKRMAERQAEEKPVKKAEKPDKKKK